jgi:hypothetical protein
MAFLFGKAFDYNDFVKQVRGFVQGHPQVLKSNDRLPQSGITITGTGTGELFVSAESFTPAGNPGSPAGSPGPGTKYRLTCTVAGNEATSPLAQFTVEQLDGISPSVLGTLTAGIRWKPDGDIDQVNSPEITSPVATRSPQHGLELILTTTTDWVVSDTIEFRLVDHLLGPTVDHNYIEQRYTETAEDSNLDFITEWQCRIPSVANAGGSPETPFYSGMKTSFDDTLSRYNVEIHGATGFEPSSAFSAQPGTSEARFMYLQKNPFVFWLVATADGFYAVARPGSVYEHITAQLVDIFATGNQHPLPIYVGAMGDTVLNNSSQTDNDEHAMPWDPGITARGMFRWVDGTWLSIQNRTNTYSKGLTKTNFIVPYAALFSQGNHDDGQFAENSMDFNRWSHQMLPRYDGSYELFPVSLIITSPQDAVVGDFKFVKYVTGNGLNAEDTTTDTSVSPQVEYIAFQNAQLSDNDNFCAMELVVG